MTPTVLRESDRCQEAPASHGIGLRSAHLIGIGGAGMSAVARALLASGIQVSGSDVSGGTECDRLREAGARIAIGHAAEHVGDAEAVVYSTAIRSTNPELALARAKGLQVLHRSEALALFLKQRVSCLVAGTHGKTTTTSMVALILADAGFDPWAFVGGTVPGLGSNLRVGGSRWAVAEADESDGSFEKLPAHHLIITNIEAEHLDHWGDEATMRAGYRRVCEAVAEGGTIVLCEDDPGTASLRRELPRPAIGYSLRPGRAEYWAEDIDARAFDSAFTVYRHGLRVGRVTVGVPGMQNVANALGATALALELGASFEAVQSALAGFRGARRRFDIKGEVNGVLVVDDYGHHPTELKATLAAARRTAAERGGQLRVAFQPHRYSRTRDCFEAFVEVLATCEWLLLTEIYAASEDPLPGVSAHRLFEAVAAKAQPWSRMMLELHRPAIAERLASGAQSGDVLLTLGAGDITRSSDEALLFLSSPSTSIPVPPAVPGVDSHVAQEEPVPGRWRSPSYSGSGNHPEL